MSIQSIVDFDGYDDLARRFRLQDADAAAPRVRGSAKRKPKKTQEQIVTELSATAENLDTSFKSTYKPARYEAIWLADSLRTFYERGLIEDVLALVKGGKEANVYLCQAAQASGLGLLAAKVYRPRQFRNLRNDKMYREGRELINSLGITIKNRDNREMRAITKKTDFGAELTHISWLMHEYVTLERLFRLGAAVPEPIATGENAILMRYIGDKGHPAPVLHAVSLAQREAERLCHEVLRNIELMLQHGMIHGDLSAYNILYWRSAVTLIDFPQVTFAESNSNARRILQRDVQRVCEYFALQGVDRNAQQIADEYWQRHVRVAIQQPADYE